MKASIAHSLDPDGAAAGHDLVTEINAHAPGRPALALLFISGDLEAGPVLDVIKSEWPGVPLIGCSSDGEASGDARCRSASSVLVMIHDTSATIRTGVCRDLSSGIDPSIQRGVAAALTPDEARGDIALLFSDALTVSGDQVVESLQRHMGGSPKIPIYGGLAADCWNFSRTNQFYNDEVLNDAAVFAVLEGVDVSSGIDSGWTALTDAAVVTRSEGNRVYAINHMPALAWYKQYLPAVGTMLGQHPLLIRTDVSAEQSLDGMLRAPLTWDADEQWITFAGDVPEGSEVSLTTVRRDDMGSAVRNAIGQAQRSFPSEQPPDLVLFFSCAARSHLLGTRTYWEVDIVNGAFDRKVPIAGAYLFGEFAPLPNTGGQSWLHNETIVPLCIGERSDGNR